MKTQRWRRIMIVCSIALLVLGVPGAIFASDDLQRDSQFLAIGMGVVGLVMTLLFLPWIERRTARNQGK